MRQKWKRTLAYLLTFVMILGIMPDTSIVSYAEENAVVAADEDSTETADTTVEQEDILTENTEEATDVNQEEQSTTTSSTKNIQLIESTTETSTEVENMETSTEVVNNTESTTETTTEAIVESTEASVDSSTENTTTEEDKSGIFTVEEEIEIQTADPVSQNYIIYSDGAWDTSRYRWFVNVNSKKHYVFCLNHGMTMHNGMYYGNLTTGYSGYSAFKKSVALNYFYKVNGNSWSGTKNYGDVQRVIWDETGSEVASKLTTYINRAWKLTNLNSARASGTSSYSSKLKGITKAQGTNTADIKKMIANLKDSKHVMDLSSSYDATSDSFKETITLGGQAWKYFNAGGYDGGSSDLVVDGVYKTDGTPLEDNSCIAKLNEDGNLEVTLKRNTAREASTAYTVIMHVKFDYKGADSINYLLTPDGKQNLTYDVDGTSSAYFAIRVWGDVDVIAAKLRINKVDEFGAFVPGCTFRLTGVQGDALTNKVDLTRTINSPSYYFPIEHPGYYKLVETAVPSSEFTLDTTEHYVYAAYNDSGKLLLYSAWKNASGNFDHYVANSSRPNLGGTHVGEGTAEFQYSFPNRYDSGAAVLTKYANILVKYENGKFVYEKKTLDDVGFTFFAAEDIYLGDTLIFSKDSEIFSGTQWGSNTSTGLNISLKHRVAIDGKRVLYEAGTDLLNSPDKYRGYTANNGKLTISDLPSGSYYCIESDLSHPGLVMAINRYDFDVVVGQTTTINGADGIINEMVPADVHVYKKDHTTKATLPGAEFTVYAHVNNTNYSGAKLFAAEQTVDVVTGRNLATGEEVVESQTWVPIQTSTSNANGVAILDNLPYGDYLIAETKAPAGYEESEKTVKFTHSLSSSTVPASGIVYEHEFTNLKSTTFEIHKVAEKSYMNDSNENNVDAYIYKNEAVEGVVFGVYAAEDIKNTLGEVVYKAGDEVRKTTTDDKGIAQFGGAMFTGKYYYKELQTADDSIYELDPNEYPFVVTGTEDTKVLTDEALINKQYKGSIKVIKTDGKTTVALSGVEFNLLDASKSVVGSYVTDTKGEIYINNLPVGTYYLQESKTKDNYILSEDVVTVTISKDNLEQEVSITNDEYKGSIKVIKTDGETTVALAGVEFNLLDSDKKVMGAYVTDEKGEILINGLSIGTYYLQESKTLDDYILDDTLQEVQISKDNLNQVVNIVNDRYKGSIKVIKTDGKTKVKLSGVEFDLLDEGKNVIGHYITDKEGEILIDNLELGTYYLQETKTKKGYKLNDDMVEVEISKEDLHKLVKIINERNETKITIKTDTTYSGSGQVRTGDMSPIGLILLLFFMSSFGAVYCARQNNWKVSMKAKKFMLAFILSVGVVFIGSLTVKAAAELKELKDVEYNGAVYKYALQKEYETSNKNEEISFDEEVEGMKLVDVQYETIETILQKKTLEETKDYKDLIVKDESKVAQTITLDGNVYELQNITWTEVPNIETVNYTVDYGYQTVEPKPEATYEYTYTSPVMKEENTVSLPFVRLEKGNEDWVDGFTATVTFHNLNGLYFKLGNHEFKYNEKNLSLTDKDFKELVKMLGYDTSKYRLNSISWSGKEYKKNNQVCRDAKASGQQYAASYKAYYEDEVENGKIYTAHATYACEVEVPAEEAAPTYVMKATAYYEEASVWANIITFITEHKGLPVIVVGGLFVFIVLLVLWLLNKKKKSTYSGEETYTE